MLLLDDDDTVSVGSRGLCYAKRALEILDRLGCGDAVVDKGVTWNVGRTFFGRDEVFQLQPAARGRAPSAGHGEPAAVLPRGVSVRRAEQLPNLELRWKHKVTGVTPQGDGRAAAGRDGRRRVCAGGRLADRRRRRAQPDPPHAGPGHRGQGVPGPLPDRRRGDEGRLPAERWFWFDPPFHPARACCCIGEADNVWRIDFQLGWDADPEEEKKPERVIPRIRAMLGPDREFELEWVSVYTFQCRRMQRFRHGRVLFVGDAAHQVSPSVRAAPTQVSRTPTTWCGSCCW